MKTTGDLYSQTTSKVYRLHAPIPRLSSHQQHKARCLALGERGRGHAINDRSVLSIALAAHSCSESDKFYGLQHLWYNVVSFVLLMAG